MTEQTLTPQISFIEELRGSGWLIGPAWLKQPEREWPEQINIIIASDTEDMPVSKLITQAKGKTTNVQ